MEEDLEQDPDTQALHAAISVLIPLRQHRQSKAERAQREAQTELTRMRNHLNESREAMGAERTNQTHRRQQLSEANVGKSMTLDDVDHWNEQELRMLDRLALIRQDIQQQGQRINAQQHSVAQAREQARAAQRAVEKLNCLAEALNDET